MNATVAIPCHNAARWLRQCISSALAQDGAEVIVVDDGSTDGSSGIAREFGERVKFIAGTRQGANHARNLALREARGDWVQFLDADDYLEPGKISAQLREADATLSEVIYSPVWIETVTPTGTTREKSRTSPDSDIFTQWIRWHIPQTGGALWRREALSRIGGWKEGQPCCQEHELYLRALLAGLKFAYAPTAGAVYRIWSEDTLCRKDPLLVARVRTELMDRLRTWLEDAGRFTVGHRRELGRQCFEMARTWARHDPAGAAAYHAERKAKGLIVPTGPAAPWKYRIAYRVLGFGAAERLAKSAR
jgi:glycosyltransferase involved in cell wall biosynthesis